MTALIFLAIPLVIIAIGGSVLYLRHRKPTSVESGIESFQREMRALSPGRGGQSGRSPQNGPGAS